MSYINLLNKFWGKRGEYELTSIEADLYLFLVHRCSLLQWENPFCLPTKEIEIALRLSRKTINNARRNLENVGLIKFQPGATNGKFAKYFLAECVSVGNTLSVECVSQSNTLPQKCVSVGNTLSVECVSQSNTLPQKCVSVGNTFKEKRKEKENIPPTPPIKEKENKKEKELASLVSRTHTYTHAYKAGQEINSIQQLRVSFTARMASEQLMKANQIYDRQEYIALCDEILAEWEIVKGTDFKITSDVKQHFINLLRIKKREKEKQRGAGAQSTRKDKREELMQSALQSVNNAINNNHAINNEQNEIATTF